MSRRHSATRGIFRKESSTKLRRDTEGFTIETQQLLLSYEWPGNIRELQNKIKRAVLLTEKPVIEPECMDISINTNTVSANSIYYDGMTEEKRSIIKALKATDGHRKKRQNCSASILLHCTVR